MSDDWAEQENEERKRKAELQRKQELKDCETLLDIPAFCRFFQRVMIDSKMLSTTFTGNSTGMFLEGQRNLALKYFSDLLEVDKQKAVNILITEEME